MSIKVWKLEKSARCYHCGDATIHSIQVDQYRMEIRCRECGFTRHYNFHMVNVKNE